MGQTIGHRITESGQGSANQIPISALPAAGALAGTETVEIVQGGASVKATVANIAGAGGPVTLTAGTTPTSGFAVGALIVNDTGNVINPVADVAVNQVLVSGGVGAKPSFSGAPVLTSVTFGTGTALNDYEEGTWTPTDNSGASLSFSVNRAVYTKIGRMVQLQFNLSYPVTGSGSGASIAGLPFPLVSQAPPIQTLQGNAAIVYTFANSPGAHFSIVTSAIAAVLNSTLSNGTVQGVISYPAT